MGDSTVSHGGHFACGQVELRVNAHQRRVGYGFNCRGGVAPPAERFGVKAKLSGTRTVPLQMNLNHRGDSRIARSVKLAKTFIV